MKRLLIAVLLILLSACSVNTPVVITATPLVATVAPTVAPVVVTVAPTVDAVLATPTVENCFENCTILKNSQLQTPCRDVTIGGLAMQMVSQWDYTWNPIVAGVLDKDLGKVPPRSKCDGFGLSYDIAFKNGVFGAETAFDADKGVKYLVKVQYSALCNNEKTSATVFNIAGEIVNADGGTTTKLTPQGLSSLTDKQPASGEALWLVQSQKNNPGGVLKIYFTVPYGVCVGGSTLKLNAIYMFPVNWDSQAIQY